MTTRKNWIAVLAALAVALVAVAAGCGGDDHGGASSSASGNATDAAFINDMTAHHQGAIDMAHMAQMKAQHPQIRHLADDIVSAQKAEISVMKAMRDDMHAMGGHGDAHMGMSEHAMGMDMDMSALKHAKPFDQAFIDAMIPHHEGAIAMARALLKKGDQPALRKMAKDIIAAQGREIAQMRAWRKAWYGSGGDSMAMGG